MNTPLQQHLEKLKQEYLNVKLKILSENKYHVVGIAPDRKREPLKFRYKIHKDSNGRFVVYGRRRKYEDKWIYEN